VGRWEGGGGGRVGGGEESSHGGGGASKLPRAEAGGDILTRSETPRSASTVRVAHRPTASAEAGHASLQQALALIYGGGGGGGGGGGRGRT
jgi:hypothetical protein